MANKGFGDESKSSAGSGVLGLAVVAGLGFVGWKAVDYFDKIRANKEIEKSTESITKSNSSIARSKQKVEQMEQKAIATGKNGNGKIATVNYSTQAKEVIDSLLVPYKDQYGVTKYSPKSSPNGTKAKNALYETPVSALGKVQQFYNIYTQRTMTDDLQKVDLQNYALIKALFNVAAKSK